MGGPCSRGKPKDRGEKDDAYNGGDRKHAAACVQVQVSKQRANTRHDRPKTQKKKSGRKEDIGFRGTNGQVHSNRQTLKKSRNNELIHERAADGDRESQGEYDSEKEAHTNLVGVLTGTEGKKKDRHSSGERQGTTHVATGRYFIPLNTKTYQESQGVQYEGLYGVVPPN